MDFDKIKKAAKNTIKIVTDKVEETISRPEDTEPTPKQFVQSINDIDDFTEGDDFLGTTQRFDMKNLSANSSKTRTERGEQVSVIDEAVLPDNDGIADKFVENAVSDFEKNLSDSISDIDADITNLSERYSHEIIKISEDISKLLNATSGSAAASEKTHKLITELSSNLESTVMDINKRLSGISSSVSGVNKINDSIFDLKNSQLNTKNTLADLDVSFSRLKKKMTAGITVLSVISAIIAVLEVINLLS